MIAVMETSNCGTSCDGAGTLFTVVLSEEVVGPYLKAVVLR